MVVIEKPLTQHVFLYDDAKVHAFEEVNKIGSTGRAYLRSIVEAKQKHVYRGWWYLIFSLKMRDKIASVADLVYQKVSFANVPASQHPTLDSTFWRRLADGDFECKSNDYAKAVDAVFADRTKNRLECRGLCELIALRSLQDALGNARFNKYLKDYLGSERLRFRLNHRLLQTEELTAKPPGTVYTGEAVFRPGDLVAFSNGRGVAAGTQWLVENALCVGWKTDGKGNPIYTEPLFRGGGVDGVKTEAEMKEYVYQQTLDPEVRGDRKSHFAEKALGGPKCNHLLDTDAIDRGVSLDKAVPNIYLHTTVERIGILGGRQDLL